MQLARLLEILTLTLQKMPLLRELKLNNSALQSIRDLGSKLKHLQVWY